MWLQKPLESSLVSHHPLLNEPRTCVVGRLRLRGLSVIIAMVSVHRATNQMTFKTAANPDVSIPIKRSPCSEGRNLIRKWASDTENLKMGREVWI